MKLTDLIANEEVPCINCIIYQDGSLFILETTNIENFKSIKIICQSSIESYFEFNDHDNLANFDMLCQYQNDKYIVYAGEGGYGSEGNICLFDKIKKEYVWLMHLEYSNPFEKVEIKENNIIAHNNNHEIWKIPINILEK